MTTGEDGEVLAEPRAIGVRHGFEIISEHIAYLERENARLNELLTTYYVNALRGDAAEVVAFIKDYGHDVHRERKTLNEAITEFQAARAALSPKSEKQDG